jgi:hypothetical protein
VNSPQHLRPPARARHGRAGMLVHARTHASCCSLQLLCCRQTRCNAQACTRHTMYAPFHAARLWSSSASRPSRVSAWSHHETHGYRLAATRSCTTSNFGCTLQRARAHTGTQLVRSAC